MVPAMGKRGWIIGGGAFVSRNEQRYVLALNNLDAPSQDEGPGAVFLDFLAHGMAFHPSHAHLAAVFEKRGPGACLVDLCDREIIAPIRTASSRRFYGHGVYSLDGSVLLATESCVDRDLAGVLVIRDTKTLRELGILPTFGVAPHDCVLINQGRTLVVANGGGPIGSDEPGCVTWIDLASGQLLDKRVVPSPLYNAGHLACTEAGELALVSAPREGQDRLDTRRGALSLSHGGGPLRILEEPKELVARMRGETLSVLIDPQHDAVWATQPLGNCVTVWRLSDGASRGVLELPGARGLAFTLDGHEVIVSHEREGSIVLSGFSAGSLQPTGLLIDPSYTTGSHLAVHPGW